MESGKIGGMQPPGSARLSFVTLKFMKPGASPCNGREMTSPIHQAPNIISVVLNILLVATISAYLVCKDQYKTRAPVCAIPQRISESVNPVHTNTDEAVDAG